MAFRSVQSRIVVSFFVLIAVVQVAALVAVHSAIERSARAQIKSQLEVTAQVFERLIAVRSRRLVEAARILTGDFPFRQVVVLGDRNTLLSAMDNHRKRIRADVMMVVSLDAVPVADTLHPEAGAQGRATFAGLPRLIAGAERAGEAADFVIIDGRLYQMAVVPVLAPDRRAWICMGFLIDQTFAAEMQRTTASHVTFVRAEPGGSWVSLASTQAPAARQSLLDALSRVAAGEGSVGASDLPGTEFETMVIPLPSSTGIEVSVTLQRSLADAMASYRSLQGALLVLFAGAAFVSIVGGVWIARGVSRPVRQLAEAARRIEAGQYGTGVATDRRDELGDLAATFNRMASAVAEREERLRESEERFRAMTESAVDAVVTTDSAGRIVSWNRGAEGIFGHAPDEVLGTPLARLVPRLSPDLGRRGVELHGVRKSGQEFPIELSLATWETRQGSFTTAIIRDVTERTQLEAQFRQAQKMESIGRLAGGVAHDFNNLLAVIMGHADLLAVDTGPEHPLYRRIDLIQKAATHAADLTKQLLAFSRKQVLAPRILDLNAVVTGIEPMLKRLIGEDVGLVIAPAPDLECVKADPAQITAIVLNLAVNARDAMPDGGKLTIETDNVELDEAHAHRHPESAPGRYVMLAVSDTGVGMDEETRSRIFEPFFTTKGPGEGTGLGLATVYGIVKQSNGNIGVYSEPGRGTTFKIYLPRVEGRAETVAVEQPGSWLGGSETILLVEDNDTVRRLFCEILRSRGYTVLEARNGADALEFTQRYHGPIDLLVTDVVMPEMGGCELARRLRDARPRMKVLYMSGYAADSIVHRGVLEEGAAFLPKPMKADTVRRKVREVLDAPAERRASG